MSSASFPQNISGTKGNKEAHYFVGIDAVDLPQLIKRPL